MGNIRKVTVLGSGVLGAQIAFQVAYCGFEVCVYDISDEAIAKAQRRFDELVAIYSKEVPGADAENTRAAAAGIETFTDLAAAVADADLVIEAIPEVLALKRQTYEKLGQVAPAKTIFATNSSTLLPSAMADATGRPERFIIFCDDLSFESGETAYKALKSVLDGSISAPPDNVLIYATSNRRHLMPEYFAENLDTTRVDDEIHPGEATEEKISLSERFGLWISFYPFSQDDYLNIVNHWLRHFGLSEKIIADCERDALNWALGRGSRSGRVAWQFARDLAGQQIPSENKSK